MPLSIKVQEGKAFTVTLSLQGRLDNDTAAGLDKELDRVLASGVKTVVFDLAGLEYLSSAGLRTFARSQKIMKARSGAALVVNPRPSVQKVLDIVKAVPVETVFRSVKELDEYLDAMQRKVTGGDASS